MLELAKAIHKAIGIESPYLFIGVFAVVGLLCFGTVAWIVDRGYRVALKEESAARAKSDRTSEPREKQPLFVGATPPQAPNPSTKTPEYSSQQPTPVPHTSVMQASKAPKKEEVVMPKDDRPNQSIVNSPGATQIGGDLVQQFIGKQGWPELTVAQGNTITEAVSTFSSQKAMVVVPNPQPDTDRLGVQIQTALQAAGWECTIQYPNRISSSPMYGIIIRSKQAAPPATTVANSLVRILGRQSVGLWDDENWNLPMIEITVYPKRQ
jgi:hypothetical protein